ncbi:MAG: right-handed parallel beta-helix repeat-containing protein, partial [Planctomycetota bacterium]
MVVISGNIAVGNGQGLCNIEPQTSPAPADLASDIIITGNTVRDTGTAVVAAGTIQVHSSNASKNSAQRAIIANNSIYDTQKTGIRIDDTSNIIIANNLVNTCARHGIYVGGSTGNERLHITGNVIRSVSTETTNTYDGIHLILCSDSVISGNTIYDSGTNHRYHLNVTSGCSDLVIGPNNYAGAAQTAKLTVGGSNHVVTPSAGTATTITDGDTTPSVAGGDQFAFANTGATTVTDFDDGVNGQTIRLRLDDNTTIQYTNAQLYLKHAEDFKGTS